MNNHKIFITFLLLLTIFGTSILGRSLRVIYCSNLFLSKEILERAPFFDRIQKEKIGKFWVHLNQWRNFRRQKGGEQKFSIFP